VLWSETACWHQDGRNARCAPNDADAAAPADVHGLCLRGARDNMCGARIDCAPIGHTAEDRGEDERDVSPRPCPKCATPPGASDSSLGAAGLARVDRDRLGGCLGAGSADGVADGFYELPELLCLDEVDEGTPTAGGGGRVVADGPRGAGAVDDMCLEEAHTVPRRWVAPKRCCECSRLAYLAACQRCASTLQHTRSVHHQSGRPRCRGASVHHACRRRLQQG